LHHADQARGQTVGKVTRGCPRNHPGLTRGAENPYKPLTAPSAQVGCTAAPPGPHDACLCCRSAEEADNYTAPAPRRFHKMFFHMDSPDPEPWQLARQLALHLQDVHPMPPFLTRPRPAGSRPGSRARHLKEPVCSSAATSLAAYCFLLLWEAQHSSPELTPVTCGERIWITTLRLHGQPKHAGLVQMHWVLPIDLFFPLQEHFHMRTQLVRN